MGPYQRLIHLMKQHNINALTTAAAAAPLVVALGTEYAQPDRGEDQYHYTFERDDGDEVEGSKHINAKKSDGYVADAGGLLGWDKEIRLAHYVIGLLVELCVTVSTLTRGAFPNNKEYGFQLWFTHLFSDVCKAVLGMGMAFNVECDREKSSRSSNNRWDVYLVIQTTPADGPSIKLETIVELKKLSPSSNELDKYASTDMFSRVSNSTWLVGDMYLINRPPWTHNQRTHTTRWFRYTSCIKSIPTCRMKKYEMHQYQVDEPKVAIERIGEILMQIMGERESPSRYIREPDVRWNACALGLVQAISNAIEKSEGPKVDNARAALKIMKKFREVGASNVIKNRETYWNHIAELGDITQNEMVDDARPQHDTDNDEDDEEEEEEEEEDDNEDEEEEDYDVDYISSYPQEVKLKGQKIDLRVPIDKRISDDVLNDAKFEVVPMSYDFDGKGSEFDISRWNPELYNNIDWGSNACIGKICKMTSKLNKNSRGREEYWVQLRHYEHNRKFKGKFYPMLPLDRLMWCANVYPEANKWQRLIEDFRMSVKRKSVKVSENGKDLVFKRDLSDLAHYGKNGPLCDDKDERLEDYFFPMWNDKNNFKFEQTAPAYLLGELLASRKRHVRGHGWRFNGKDICEVWGNPQVQQTEGDNTTADVEIEKLKEQNNDWQTQNNRLINAIQKLNEEAKKNKIELDNLKEQLRDQGNDDDGDEMMQEAEEEAHSVAHLSDDEEEISDSQPGFGQVIVPGTPPREQGKNKYRQLDGAQRRDPPKGNGDNGVPSSLPGSPNDVIAIPETPPEEEEEEKKGQRQPGSEDARQNMDNFDSDSSLTEPDTPQSPLRIQRGGKRKKNGPVKFPESVFPLKFRKQ